MSYFQKRERDVIAAPGVEVLDRFGRPIRKARRIGAPATYLILGANIAVFYLFNATHPQGMPPLHLAYWPEAGQVFPQLLTHMFVHADVMHIFSNMLMVFFLGAMVEELYGTKRYATIYLTAGIVAALAQNFFDGGGPLIGASGAASAILPMFVRHFPNARLLMFGFVPTPAWLAALIILGMNIVGTMNAGAGSVLLPANVAYVAHLAGLATGLVLSLILLPPGWQRRRRQPNW